MDNGSGVATLVGVMEHLVGADLSVAPDIVPFNGEEHFAVPGQLAYLRDRKPSVETTSLVINVDGLGHIDSRNAYSYYNVSEEDAARIGDIVEKSDTVDNVDGTLIETAADTVTEIIRSMD